MVDYFERNGAANGFGPYSALSLNDDKLALNVPYTTVLGPVDADWMFTSYFYGAGNTKVGANLAFYGGKLFRNATSGEGGLFDQFNDPSYTNAPKAIADLTSAINWKYNFGQNLRTLFGPALKNCACAGN